MPAPQRKPPTRRQWELICKRLYGCSPEWLDLLGGKKGRVPVAYLNQKNGAKGRAIGWRFTLPDWWAVWSASGKWMQRGNSGGKCYCMARRGDLGPYAPTNVVIATVRENAGRLIR